MALSVRYVMRCVCGGSKISPITSALAVRQSRPPSAGRSAPSSLAFPGLRSHKTLSKAVRGRCIISGRLPLDHFSPLSYWCGGMRSSVSHTANPTPPDAMLLAGLAFPAAQPIAFRQISVLHTP